MLSLKDIPYMKNLHFLAVCGLLAAVASIVMGPAHAQSTSVGDLKDTAAAIQSLQDQQKSISENEDKIDAKLATIAENVRVARIYASRVK
jgi:hypothetical protein